ncbi:hypothetical protein CQA89_33060, partial [Klebsiella pneumoniae]
HRIPGSAILRSLKRLTLLQMAARNIKCEAQMLNHTATTAKPPDTRERDTQIAQAPYPAADGGAEHKVRGADA